MSTLLPVVYKILPLYLFIVLGFFAGRRLQVDKDTIAKLLIYVIAPMIVFHGAMSADLQLGLILVPIVFYVTATVLCLSTYLIAKRVWPNTAENKTSNILAFSAGTGNTGYFGLPIAVALFGPASLSVVVFTSLGGILYENTVGFYITARGHHTASEALWKIAKLPTLYAFIAGLLLHALPIASNQNYLDVITLVHGAYSVLGMMIIGFGLANLKNVKVDWKYVTTALSLKFIVVPLVFLCIVWLDAHTVQLFSSEIVRVLLLMSVVPLASNTITYAALLKTHPEQAAVAVASSTVLAAVTIPLTLHWFGLL